MRLGDLDALKKEIENLIGYSLSYEAILNAIDNAPTVELNESVIQEVLNKRCMTAVANEYLIALHGKRPQGEWVKVKEERMSIDMSGEIVTRYKCSKCGRVIATFPSKLANYYPFCHCGADMRKGGAKMKGGAI